MALFIHNPPVDATLDCHKAEAPERGEAPQKLPWDTPEGEKKFFFGSTKKEIFRLLMGGVAVAILLKIFVVEVMFVASTSMEPTLLEGDCIVVNKLAYGLRLPHTIPFTRFEIFSKPLVVGTSPIQKGDVVVFDSPADSSFIVKRVVKRVTAMPGDKVNFKTRNFMKNISLRLPHAGEKVRLSRSTYHKWKPLIEEEGFSVVLKNNIVFIDGEPTAEYVFRQNFFFLTGDNAQNSFDSRFVGPIGEERIAGKVSFIYWSIAENSFFRWRTDRIGDKVQ